MHYAAIKEDTEPVNFLTKSKADLDAEDLTKVKNY